MSLKEFFETNLYGEFVVVSTVRNAVGRVRACAASVRHQTVPCHHVFVDAASSDGTGDVLKTFAMTAMVRGTFELRELTYPAPVLENLVSIIHTLPDETIVVWLDGDDCLLHPRVLEVVRNEYHAHDLWVTYGSFIWEDGRTGICGPMVPPLRGKGWTASHLRTFKAGLFKRIAIRDLKNKKGQWYGVTDLPVMMPLLEMAGPRAKFISNFLVLYDGYHYFQRGEEEKAGELQEIIEIRAKPPYTQIETI